MAKKLSSDLTINGEEYEVRLLLQNEGQDRTTDILLIILTLLLAISAMVFYPIFRMFPFFEIWTFIYVSIEIGFFLILIFGVRSTVKGIRWFLIIANTFCIILNSVLLFLYMVPRGLLEEWKYYSMHLW